MRLLLVGCEYVGGTTLAHAIDDWMFEKMGARFSLIHEHWKIPHTSGHPDDTTSEEQAWLLQASPKFKEMHQRHSLYYHVQANTFNQHDGMVVGGHIEEAVYAPMFFGYGGKGEAHDRELVAHQVENTILRFTKDTVIVHIAADTDVIAQRMKDIDLWIDKLNAEKNKSDRVVKEPEELTDDEILTMLDSTDGNKKEAAKLLGLSNTAFQTRYKEIVRDG